MATVFFTWELGSGLGHMALLEPLVRGLANRGHRVAVALRNLASAGKVFGGIPIEFLPAPMRSGSIAGDAQCIATYVQLLHRHGFGDANELDILVQAWRNLYAYVRPDLVVANYSPTALLAARGLRTPIVAVGTGFCCPADCSPYPDWRAELGIDPKQILQEEFVVRDNATTVLERHGAPLLSRLGELFSGVTDTLLATYPELDPFGHRPNIDYLGVWPDPSGVPPQWPERGEVRALVYLRPLAGIENILRMLINKNVAAILRIPGASDALRRNFNAPNLRWETDFLDLATTLHQCDLGICHATHQMSAGLLHAGKPILMFPPFLEQGLTAMKIAGRRAGLLSSMEDVPHFTAAFDKLVRDPAYRQSAEEFARKYPSERRQQQLDVAVSRLTRLIES